MHSLITAIPAIKLGQGKDYSIKVLFILTVDRLDFYKLVMIDCATIKLWQFRQQMNEFRPTTRKLNLVQMTEVLNQ